MFRTTRMRIFTAGTAAVLLLGPIVGHFDSAGASTGGYLLFCVNNNNGSVRVVSSLSSCNSNEHGESVPVQGTTGPTGPTGADEPVISPWFGDVDTRGTLSGVLHIRQDIPNETILTWDNVGYFNSHDDKLDSFQLVVRGPGFAVPAGEGTIGFFYKGMPWESTDTSVTGAIGFGNGAGESIVLQGSNTAGLNAVVQGHFIWFNQNLAPVPLETFLSRLEGEIQARS